MLEYAYMPAPFDIQLILAGMGINKEGKEEKRTWCGAQPQKNFEKPTPL